MRFKLTLFLIIANLITFGLIVFETLRSPLNERFGQSVFSAEIKEISVAGTESTEVFTLSLKNKEWTICSPFRWPANPFEVNRVLNELKFLDSDIGFPVKEVLEIGSSLANYGLETPKITLTVVDSTGTHTLKIGNVTPDGRSVYVLTPDSQYIIPAPKALIEWLSKSPSSYRIREIFTMRPYEVQAITERLAFRGGDEQRIGLIRSKNDSDFTQKASGYSWKFETPILTRADTQKVEELLSEIASASYVRFIPNDIKLIEQAGLKNPWLKITLEGARQRQTLLVGNPDPEDKTGKTLFAKLEDNDAIFTLPNALFDIWKNPLDELREAKFFDFNPDYLSTITITDSNSTLLLRRGNSTKQNSENSEILLNANPEESAQIESIYQTWQMPVAPSSRVTKITDVEPQKLKEFVEKLSAIRATNFPINDAMSAAQKKLRKAFVSDNASEEDFEKLNLKTPEKKVELIFQNPKDPHGKTIVKTIKIAKPVEPNSPYHASVGNAIYSISPVVLDVITTNPNFFCSRKIYSLPVGAKINKIKLIDISEKPAVAILDESAEQNNDWQNQSAEEATPRSQAIVKLANCLANLAAVNFLSENFSLDFKFDYQDSGATETWRYRLDCEILLPPNGSQTTRTETQTYYFTKRLGGRYQLAGTPQKNIIFTIPQEFIDALHTLTFAENPQKDIPEILIPQPVDLPPPNPITETK